MQQDAQPAGRMSGLAVASLVLPIVGYRFIGPLGFPVGLVLAIVALVQIRRSHGRLRGTGLAVAGLCVSVLLPVLLYPVFARARESAVKMNCQTNVESISRAVQVFVTERGVYPDAATWIDDVAPYLNGPLDFRCGRARDLKCAYAYNAALSRAPGNSVAPDTVTIFESDAGWNASGSPPRILPTKPRHLGGDIFGYADGSARWQRRPTSATAAKPWVGDVPSRSGRGPAGRTGAGAKSP